MFERWTDRNRRVIALAQEEASRLSHGYLGSEHLLLGFISEGEGIAGIVLKKLGFTLEDARESVESHVGIGNSTYTNKSLPFTSRCKKILENSLLEALMLGHNYVGTEHTLLAIVGEPESTANLILSENLDSVLDVKDAIMNELSGYQTPARITTQGNLTQGSWLDSITKSYPAKIETSTVKLWAGGNEPVLEIPLDQYTSLRDTYGKG